MIVEAPVEVKMKCTKEKLKAHAKYMPLIVFQIILMVLFIVFVKYEGPKVEPVAVAGAAPKPAPSANTDGTMRQGVAPTASGVAPAASGVAPAAASVAPAAATGATNLLRQGVAAPTNTKYERDSEIKGFEDTHVMIFIGFGFLMTFLKKYGYSALGLNLLLAALSVQWALLCQNFFHMKDGQIILTKKMLVEADVMSATVLITFGALLGVASTFQLVFISIVEIAIGCVNIHLIGDIFKAADVGGSMAIHAFGAYFGIGASIAMNMSKKEQSRPANAMAGSSYTSDITAMIGTLFLWVYWPSFNAALCKTSWEYQRAVINTYLSLASATVTTFFISALVTKHFKLDMVHVQNSTLAGGVAVGSLANMAIGPGAAIAVGIVAGVISVLGYRHITPCLARRGVVDTCGVNNLHGLPGVLSGLLSIVFAFLAKESQYGADYIKDVFPHGGGGTQALKQLYALIGTVVVSLVAGLLTGLIARRVLPSLKEEQKYIDEPNWELPA